MRDTCEREGDGKNWTKIAWRNFYKFLNDLPLFLYFLTVHKNITNASSVAEVDLHFTTLRQAKQFIETCGM